MTDYNYAKKQYAAIGVNTDAALAKLSATKISLHCWQGDDVRGFLRSDDLSGGISVTGNYPGAARTPQELRADLEVAFSLIPGKHKVNLHAIYADTAESVELDRLEPEHFANWVNWAKANGLGLDFNPTCFSHPMFRDGFSISHPDSEVRAFWIEHCKRCRHIAAWFGKELGQTAVTNFWFPDGYKDIPFDRLAPRRRMKESLDEIFVEEYDKELTLDAVESKLFGIGSESYVVGSHEFCSAYAIKNEKLVCLDCGHFHPTETVSNKLSSFELFDTGILLHVSRPVRWDSDHVVLLDDELLEIARELVRNNMLGKTHIGLDYFDASINRIAAWVLGARNLQKALLKALLEPSELLRGAENRMDFTERLVLLEESKCYPFETVWRQFCESCDMPAGPEWLNYVRAYENSVLRQRS